MNTSQSLKFSTTTSFNRALLQEFICGQKIKPTERIALFHAFFAYINPSVAIIGLITNTLSLEILRNSGLNKPSNILLFGLVVSDSMSLLITLNFSKFVLFYGPNRIYSSGFCHYKYGEELNYFLAFSSNFIVFVGFWGRHVGSSIPIFITLERLFAIFRPMTFKHFVTPKRCIVLIVSLFLFWMPYTVVVAAYYKIVSETKAGANLVRLDYNDFLLENIFLLEDIQHWGADPVLSWFPLTFVSIGCTVLVIKIKLALIKRRNLTSAQKSISWSPRTTRTLLLTCLVFAVTHSVASLLLYFYLQDMDFIAINIHIRNNFIFFFLNINAASNFIVYISTNRKLLDIFIALFRRKHQSKTSKH